MPIGFIGLGQIGTPIALRLVNAGNPLIVHDRRPEAAEALVRAGASLARSAAELAATCDTVFACVTTVDTFRDVVCGSEGLCAGPTMLRRYVHLGTTGSACAVELASALAAHGVATIDAPVTGGIEKAGAGALTTMASGPREAFEQVQGLIRTYSTTVVYLGEEPGAAQVMKSINNMMSRINWAAACEAMVLGAKAGLDPEQMLEVLNHGSGQNDGTSRKMPLALANRTLGAALYISQKDVSLWREEVDRLGVECTIGDSAQRVYERVFREAQLTDDALSLLSHVERWAGVQVRRHAQATSVIPDEPPRP